jgi:hypothetical protein
VTKLNQAPTAAMLAAIAEPAVVSADISSLWRANVRPEVSIVKGPDGAMRLRLRSLLWWVAPVEVGDVLLVVLVLVMECANDLEKSLVLLLPSNVKLWLWPCLAV